MNYYTYIYIDPVRNIPRYVGYGHGNRAYSHLIKTHNKTFAGWIRNLKDRSLAPVIIKEDVKSKSEAKLLERFWISIYGRIDKSTGCLFNHTDGGDGGSGRIFNHSKETKQKMSETRKGRISPMIGKTHSEETKQKMSDSHAGENNHFYGRTHTQEVKDNHSEVMKGKLTGDKNPFYGKRHSKEIQDKISAQNRGRKKTPEELARRSATIQMKKLLSKTDK